MLDTEDTSIYNRRHMHKRLVIFVFYDKEGILDDYAAECVRSLQQDVGPVVFVINGLLNEEGRAKIIPYVWQILQRENKGLDAWAFKEGLEYIGYQNLGNYDEILLMNDTCFGPLYPWGEVFDKMAARPELDFWGLTSTTVLLKHLIKEKRLMGRHIDSYFTVFRKRLLAHQDFHAYWQKLPKIDNYDQAIAHHERQIGEYLVSRGFRWGVAYFVKDGCDHVFFSPYRLIHDQRCPLLKRRCFTHPVYLEYLRQGKAGDIYKTLDFIEKNLHYDTQLIWRHILRFAGEETVLRNLGAANHLDHPLAQEPEIKLSMLHRVNIRLSAKEKAALFAWRVSKAVKKVIKIFLYPFTYKYVRKQRRQI